MANWQLLNVCYFFLLQYFLSVSLPYTLSGSSVCKPWVCHPSSLPTAVSWAQIMSTESRMCLWCKNFNSCTHKNVIMTRNTARVRNEFFLPPWCPGTAVFFIKHPRDFFPSIWGTMWEAKIYIHQILQLFSCRVCKWCLRKCACLVFVLLLWCWIVVNEPVKEFLSCCSKKGILK